MKESPFGKTKPVVSDAGSVSPGYVDPYPHASPFTAPQISPVPTAGVPMPVPASTPFANAPRSEALPRLSFSVDDIENLGRDNSQASNLLSDRITQKMTLNRMGELGEALSLASNTIRDRASGEIKSGVFGWFTNKTVAVRTELEKRFKTAEQVCDDILKAQSKHVQLMREWERDDTQLETENYERFKRYKADQAKLENWAQQVSAALAAWPQVDPSDPEAFMKNQQRQTIAELGTRLDVRRESLIKGAAECEINSVELAVMKDASIKLAAKITADITDVFPAIKRRLAKHIQALNLNSTGDSVSAFGTLANRVLRGNSQATKDAVLKANRLFQEATISNETILSMQNAVRETMQGMQQIAAEGAARRERDTKQIIETQQQLLRDIQQGATRV